MKLTMPKFDEDLVLAIEQHLKQDHWTEIRRVYDTSDGLRVQVAEGRAQHPYGRPMFQLVHPRYSSSSLTSVKPCPNCDDWARTARCNEHHDLAGIAGLERGRVRPLTSSTWARHVANSRGVQGVTFDFSPWAGSA